jgi:hypothetical protein
MGSMLARVKEIFSSDRIKRVAALVLLCGGLTGCTTWTSYETLAPVGTPTPADYPIPVYNPDQEPPRPCEPLVVVSIHHTPLTIVGGGITTEMQQVMKLAHTDGADAVQVVAVQKPGFDSGNFSLQARLLRYLDQWERLPLSEKDFVAYLQKHRATLDPIEGIWSDGLPHELGIIRNASMPGRDFIAFTLVPDVPSWAAGDKKMDIARGDAPGSYAIKFYKDDFSSSDLVVNLEENRRFQFILNDDDKSLPIMFTKLELPVPAR